MFLEVKKAEYLNDFKVFIEFSDGVSKTIDLEKELDGAVFEPLKNKDYFKSFTIKFNTIEWDNGADFAPEYLYEIGQNSDKINKLHPRWAEAIKLSDTGFGGLALPAFWAEADIIDSKFFDIRAFQKLCRTTEIAISFEEAGILASKFWESE